MDHMTYDPILEEQELSRVRLFSPPRAPRPREALVLAPGRGPMCTIRHSDPIPGARLTDYRRLYRVDVAEHRLVLDFPLLSRDHTFAFNARATLTCQVTDPAKVVSRNIRDMSGALYGPLKGMLQDVSKHYDISHFHAAQEALNQEMRYFSGDSAIRLHSIHIELLVNEEEAAESGRMFRDVAREQRLADMKADHQLERLRSTGVEGLIADIFVEKGAEAALARIREIEGEERGEILAAWEAVLKHSEDSVDPYLLAEAHKELLAKYVEGSSAPFGGTRSGRLRGSLTPGVMSSIEPPSAPPPSVSSPSAEASDRSPGGSSPRVGRHSEHRPSPAYGDPGAPAGPPDDEPPGTPAHSPGAEPAGARRDSGAGWGTAWDPSTSASAGAPPPPVSGKVPGAGPAQPSGGARMGGASTDRTADGTRPGGDDAAGGDAGDDGDAPGGHPASRLRGFRTGEPGR
ncbi:hypothetical protein [Actinomadura formosensis]|uniref:hypothetical protein n=1 Tax=Actinomadura formosensis TaxID=60706 RepID=UPI003D8AC9C4